MAVIYFLTHFVAKKCKFEYAAPSNGSLGNCDGKDEIEYGAAGCMFKCSPGFILKKEFEDVQFKCSVGGEIDPDPMSIECVGTSLVFKFMADGNKNSLARLVFDVCAEHVYLNVLQVGK